MNGWRWGDWQAWVCRSPAFGVVLVSLSVLAVLVAGYFIRLREPGLAYGAAAVQARAVQQALQEREAQLAELGAERQALEEAEQHVRTERWRLSAGEGISDWLDTLAVSGHEHGLLFERLDVREERRELDYRLIPLEVRVRGRYPAVRAWLEQGQRQLRLLNVARLRLTRADERSDLVVGQLLINAYHAGEALPVPAELAHEPARQALAVTAFDPFRAWSSARPDLGLGRIPLEQLEMVGTLARGGRHQALLRSGGHVYRVGEGETLGRDEGIVVAIAADQVTVRERIYIGDAWQERHRYLLLGGRVKGEVRDEADAMVEHDTARTGGGAGRLGDRG